VLERDSVRHADKVARLRKSVRPKWGRARRHAVSDLDGIHAFADGRDSGAGLVAHHAWIAHDVQVEREICCNPNVRREFGAAHPNTSDLQLALMAQETYYLCNEMLRVQAADRVLIIGMGLAQGAYVALSQSRVTAAVQD
jgi:hypothetical protein